MQKATSDSRRRDFLRKSTYASAGLLISGCLYNDRISSDHDKFGGWKAKRLTKTGFFHTEYDGRRWWLVSPEGNAFLSFGINHYHDIWWREEYNKKHWLKTFGSTSAGDDQWQEGFRREALNDLNRLGINTLGMHTNAQMLTDFPFTPKVPYLRSYKPLVLDHYRHPKSEVYIDIFDTSFEELCNESAEKITTTYVNDPMLLGYCMADCPIFTDEDVSEMGATTTWPRLLRNLGSLAPGKQAYVETMQKQHLSIQSFNITYNSSFNSWQELTEAENWSGNIPPTSSKEQADNDAFLLVCVNQYYSVAKSALRRVDPNHLFFGDKLNGNTDNMEKNLEVAAKYVDVILYQHYDHCSGQMALLDKLTSRVNLPFINGDTGFSVPDEMMPNPYGPHAKDQRERAKWLKECCENVFAHPDFVGWHMCGIIDTWKTMIGKETNQHQGLMSIKGEFYPEMEEAVKEISSLIYTTASGHLSNY